MAYAKSDLGDLKQSLADRHDSGVLPTDSATLTYWGRILNKGQAYCADRLNLNKETTLTTSGGTIALPDDFKSINKVYLDSTPFAQVREDEIYKQSGDVFWITGNHDTGFSLNTPSDDEYTVEYYYHPADMATDSAECIIPDPEAVVAYAYSMLRKAETDPIGDADKAMQECDARLASVANDHMANNNFTGFSFPI